MNDVAQHRGLRTRVHVDAERYVELSGVHAERNGRKNYYFRSCIPGDSCCGDRDVGRLVVVGPVGEMEVVSFSCSPRKNRYLVLSLPDRLPCRFFEHIGSTGQASAPFEIPENLETIKAVYS